MGLTVLCSRAATTSSDLTDKELSFGLQQLKEKLRTYKPRICCFVGKGLFESIIGSKVTHSNMFN
jgi:TDG/mug DNA glycosylase family protein